MNDTNQQGENQASELIDIQWTAPEFEKHEKGPAWFLVVGFFALIFFTIALLMKNFIFAILIMLAVFTIFIYALKTPRQINFKIKGEGITISDKLYPFEDLSSFWIFYEPPRIKELSIKSKKTLTMMIRIPLSNQDPSSIRQALIKFIPEEKQEESLVDIIFKSIGF